MPIKIDSSELEALIAKMKDTSLLKRASSNALYNASAELASYSKKNHIFKTRTSKLENSIEVDVRGLSSSIFVDSAKVNYATYIYEGTGRIKAEPWIENNYKKRFKQFQDTFADELTEQIQDYI